MNAHLQFYKADILCFQSNMEKKMTQAPSNSQDMYKQHNPVRPLHSAAANRLATHSLRGGPQLPRNKITTVCCGPGSTMKKQAPHWHQDSRQSTHRPSKTEMSFCCFFSLHLQDVKFKEASVERDIISLHSTQLTVEYRRTWLPQIAYDFN